MVVTTTIKTNVKTAALAEFDAMTHVGFGTGVATPADVDTDLTTPLIRVAFDESAVKSVAAGTYDFSGLLGLTQGNGNTIGEVGIFDAASSGNMGIKLLLPSTIAKIATLEVSVGIRLTVNVS